MSEQHDAFPAAPLDLDKIDVGELRARWPRALAEMHDVLVAGFGDRADAITLATLALRALARHVGGRQWYLPTGKTLELGLRDRMIWRDFNGRNVHELIQKYQLTEVHIYEILAQQRALVTKKIQPDLFASQP